MYEGTQRARKERDRRQETGRAPGHRGRGSGGEGRRGCGGKSGRETDTWVSTWPGPEAGKGGTEPETRLGPDSVDERTSCGTTGPLEEVVWLLLTTGGKLEVVVVDVFMKDCLELLSSMCMEDYDITCSQAYQHPFLTRVVGNAEDLCGRRMESPL